MHTSAKALPQGSELARISISDVAAANNLCRLRLMLRRFSDAVARRDNHKPRARLRRAFDGVAVFSQR
jgi:hypothetical protein